MHVKNVGEVVAERELLVDGKPVVITIGKPVRIPEEGDLSAYFECPLRITGEGINYFQSIGGLDSMQALVLALQFIGAELQRKQVEQKITWEGEEDLGFPLMKIRV